MLKIEKFTGVCMTGGMHYTPSHTKVVIDVIGRYSGVPLYADLAKTESGAPGSGYFNPD